MGDPSGYDFAICRHCNVQRFKHGCEHAFDPVEGDEWCNGHDDWLANCECDEEQDDRC